MTYSSCGTTACGTEGSVQLMKETFDYCDPAQSQNVVSDSGWYGSNGMALANGCSDGAMTLAKVDASGMDSVTIDITIASSNVGNFEGGQCGDTFTVEVWDGTCWVVLDTFTRVGDKLVGSKTGQTFDGCSWSKLSYTIDDPADDIQFRVNANFSASDEVVGISEVCITGVPTPEPVCEPVYTTLLFEDFAGVCEPIQSKDVIHDDNWKVYYESAYADGCNDGAMVFNTVNTSGQDEVTITFDIASGNLCNWESSGCDADWVAVYVNRGNCWETLDVYVRDGNVVRGNMTGQTFRDGYWTEVSYTITNPTDKLTFAVVTNLTAGDEYMWLDNVEIVGKAEGECAVEPAPLASLGGLVWNDADFDGIRDTGEALIAGATVELYRDGVATGVIATTDANGAYLFEGLEAGNYSVQVSNLASDLVFTLQNIGSDLTDSDVNATGRSSSVAVAEGQDVRDVDAGVYDRTTLLGSIGDVVFLDANGNGVQDAGEAGVEGVTVALLKDGVLTGDTVVTGADGAYLFDGLEAGSYQVQVSGVAEGYEFTTQNAGGEAVDSDVNAAGLSDAYALAAGEDYFDLDAGIVASTPTVANDSGMICADEVATLDVLANDDSGLTITAINGQSIVAGGTITLESGAVIGLTDGGLLTYDASVSVNSGLTYGQSAMDSFTYTATTAQGGEAVAAVSMMIEGPISSLADIAASLPETVQMTVNDLYDLGGVFDITVTSAENPRLNSIEHGAVWCVDVEGEVLDGVELTANIYLSDENDASLGEFVVNYQNLDLVNYILNQDYASQGYTDNQIQDAIWYLTDDLFTLFDPGVVDIVSDAYEFGEGFEAGEGDIVGLIVAPIQQLDDTGAEITNYQNFIYGVEYDLLTDCLMAA